MNPEVTRREKEIALAPPSTPVPEDPEEYEAYFRKHILPIEERRCKKKENLIKKYCQKKNRRLPTFTIDSLDGKIEVLTDDSDKEEIENLSSSPSLEDDEIKLYKKGKQVSFFSFEGGKENLNEFPMAIEGDFIILQEYEMEDGDWERLEYFTKHPTKSLLTCYLLPYGQLF